VLIYTRLIAAGAARASTPLVFLLVARELAAFAIEDEVVALFQVSINCNPS